MWSIFCVHNDHFASTYFFVGVHVSFLFFEQDVFSSASLIPHAFTSSLLEETITETFARKSFYIPSRDILAAGIPLLTSILRMEQRIFEILEVESI